MSKYIVKGMFVVHQLIKERKVLHVVWHFMLCQVHGNNYDEEVYFIQDQELSYRAAVSVILQLTLFGSRGGGGGGLL